MFVIVSSGVSCTLMPTDDMNIKRIVIPKSVISACFTPLCRTPALLSDLLGGAHKSTHSTVTGRILVRYARCYVQSWQIGMRLVLVSLADNVGAG